MKKILEQGPENPEEIAVSFWWHDKFLPCVAGLKYYGKEVRHYKRKTDKILVHGALKTAVTPQTEGFALVMLDNCRKKWINIFEFQEQFPDKAIPVKGDVAEPFKGKFTNPKCGQDMFGGWSREGMLKYEEYKTFIQTIRAEDADNNFAISEQAKNIMREALKIDATAPKKGRKRKRSTDSDASDSSANAPKTPVLTEDVDE